MKNEQSNDRNGFSYTYSAKEQTELKRIRDKYAPQEESKLERLRRLDKSTTHRALAVALVLGILGAIILGFGMSLIMEQAFADALGISQDHVMKIGIPIGLVGCLLVAIAYPVYRHIVKRDREKLAPEIIHLTDELMK